VHGETAAGSGWFFSRFRSPAAHKRREALGPGRFPRAVTIQGIPYVIEKTLRIIANFTRNH
jgi:hypothetical protein